MKPDINGTEFGSITINGTTYEYDVIIRLDGEVKKRKKKLSKTIFGSSHIISLDEAKHMYEKGAKLLIIGSGQNGVLTMSEEAEEYFRKKACKVMLQHTPLAIQTWNNIHEKVIGMFHVTC